MEDILRLIISPFQNIFQIKKNNFYRLSTITFFSRNRYNRYWGVETMNKKEIAAIRRQFKPENELMEIRDIFNVYVQKETGTIFHHDSRPFELLDKESQDLFYENCKKVLTGQVNAKLFTLKFQRDVEDSTQTILYEGLATTDRDYWQTQMLQIVEKMFEHQVYDFDTVVTFIYGEYRKPMKKRGPESGEGGTDEVYANKFILSSLNKTTQPETSLVFDYIEKEFKANSEVDPIINLTKPLSGFLFPAFHDNASDVNHILYSAGKANEPDETFIHDVLNCQDTVTAAEEKDGFELVVSKLAGDQVDANVLSNIYEEIDQIIQENEEDEAETASPSLGYRDVEHILSMSGVENIDTEKVKDTFQTIFADDQHAFKADSLLPKKVKINTEIAKLSISPEHLKNVKYITYQGKRCLLLEIEDHVEIEGFHLESAPF